jgi:hypothetical protein
VGTNTLPFGVTTEVEAVVEVVLKPLKLTP